MVNVLAFSHVNARKFVWLNFVAILSRYSEFTYLTSSVMMEADIVINMLQIYSFIKYIHVIIIYIIKIIL